DPTWGVGTSRTAISPVRNDWTTCFMARSIHPRTKRLATARGRSSPRRPAGRLPARGRGGLAAPHGPHEFVHGLPPGLADPGPPEDLPHRHRQDLGVEPERPVIHVPDVEPEL